MLTSNASLFTGTLVEETDPFFNQTVLLLKSAGSGKGNKSFIDSSSNNLAMSANGDVTQGSVSPYIPNGFWGAYFDGTGDYLSVSMNDALQMGTGDYTFECWVNPATAGNYALYSDRSGNNLSGMLILIHAGLLYLLVAQGGNWVVNAMGTDSMVPNTWNHVAVCRSGTSWKGFLNGVQQFSANTTTVITPAQTGPVTIGYEAGAAYPALVGHISNVRVIKGTALYATAFTPPTAPLTAISGTSLLTCQDNRFIDRSSNNFTITPAGNVAVTRLSPFNTAIATTSSQFTYGGSGYFGGTDYLSLAPNTGLGFGTGDFTVEGWFYRTDNNSLRTLFSIGIYTEGLMWRSDYFAFGNTINTSFNSVMPVGAWFHAAVTRSGSSLRVFINGAVVGTYTTSVNHIQSYGTTVGSAVHASTEAWSGYIANFRVVKGTALYTTTFTPPNSPVTAISGTSLLLNFDNAGMYDSSGNTNMQSLGGVKTSTSVSKYGTASVEFDGSGDRLWTEKSSRTFDLEGQFTVEAWVNFSATAGKVNYIFNYLNDSEVGWMLRYVNTGALRFYMGASYSFDRTWTAALNTWYHLAATRDSSNNVRLFIDGVQQGAAVNISVAASQSQYGLQIGGTDVQGFIEDARVTKGVARYTANFTPPTRPLPVR